MKRRKIDLRSTWRRRGLEVCEMNPCKPLYLLVTSDKYELPLAVADSMEELARMAGVTVGTVTSSISRRN